MSVFASESIVYQKLNVVFGIYTFISCLDMSQASPRPTTNGVGNVPLLIPRSCPPPLCIGRNFTRGLRLTYKAPIPALRNASKLRRKSWIFSAFRSCLLRLFSNFNSGARISNRKEFLFGFYQLKIALFAAASLQPLELLLAQEPTKHSKRLCYGSAFSPFFKT